MVLTTTWYTYDSHFYQQTDSISVEGLKSMALEELHLVERIYQNIHKKSFDIIKRNKEIWF